MRTTASSPWRFAILLLAAGSVACLSAMTTAPGGDRLQSGAWGGEHVALTVTDAGARLEFDCAFGEVHQPLMLDADSRVAVEGVYWVERGPVIVGKEPERKPARYAGRLSGDKLTFAVTLIESNEAIGNFTVVHGAAPRGMIKCR